MREIKLSNSREVALVDDELFEFLNQFTWRRSPKGYAIASVPMHQLVCGIKPEKSLVLDHINGDRLDNRKGNGQYITHRENCLKKQSKTGASGYRGLTPRGRRHKASITIDKQQKILGLFDDPRVGAIARDCAVRNHYGKFARPNFPDDEFALLWEQHKEEILQKSTNEQKRILVTKTDPMPPQSGLVTYLKPGVGVKLSNRDIEAIVDVDDLDRVRLFTWRLTPKGYAAANIPMHHLVLTKRSGFVMDHKDRNRLNNQQSNLRYATHAQNSHNLRKKIGQAGYIGVTKRPNGKFRASVSIDGQPHKWSSVYETAIIAAVARDWKVRELRGEFGVTNFSEEEFTALWQQYSSTILNPKKNVGQSRYPNVYWCNNRKVRPWRASVDYKGERYRLGQYETQEEAWTAVVKFREEHNLPYKHCNQSQN